MKTAIIAGLLMLTMLITPTNAQNKLDVNLVTAKASGGAFVALTGSTSCNSSNTVCEWQAQGHHTFPVPGATGSITGGDSCTIGVSLMCNTGSSGSYLYSIVGYPEFCGVWVTATTNTQLGEFSATSCF